MVQKDSGEKEDCGFRSRLEPPSAGLRAGSGAGGGMDEVALYGDAIILVVIGVWMLTNRRSKDDLHDRVDDVVHGLAALARELLDRTDRITELAGRMPEISLVNSDPISNILRILHGFKTGNFDFESGDTYKGPRDSAGRYAPALEEETNTPETPEIDFVD
jgi:hypothetical protein